MVGNRLIEFGKFMTLFSKSWALLGAFVENETSEKIKQSDFDRAFNELASFLYEKYRKQKQEEQIQETMDDFEQDNTCDII